MGSLPYSADPGQTHYDGCWRERGHHNCAVQHIAVLRAALADVERLHLYRVGDEIVAHCPTCGMRTPKHGEGRSLAAALVEPEEPKP